MYNFDNDPRLANVHPLKLQIIKQLAQGSTNKSMEQLLPDMMRINSELNKRNLSFTKNETNIIMDILTEQASPEDRRKISLIRNML
ncbi:MAG: hypothetical protein ACI4EF_00320 [Coprococcus sp.]